ncbi:MAG: hypothetical protein H6869_06585, partial [Rhodospirillales bacterium]|nr:hypothetical protein [Rhodospirillales bacterium]
MTIPDGTKLEIAWHKDTIGVLTMQDAKWHWQSANTKEARIFEGSAPGTMPALLKNLMPEGWLAKILHDNNKRDSYLSEGIRFLSNITIATDSDVMGNVPFDRLQATVDDFKTEDGLFSGTYNGPTAPEVDENFQKQLAAHWQNRCMPKFSGV